MHTQPNGLFAPKPMASSVRNPDVACVSTVAVTATRVHWSVDDENAKQYSDTVVSDRVPAYAGEALNSAVETLQAARAAIIRSRT